MIKARSDDCGMIICGAHISKWMSNFFRCLRWPCLIFFMWDEDIFADVFEKICSKVDFNCFVVRSFSCVQCCRIDEGEVDDADGLDEG